MSTANSKDKTHSPKINPFGDSQAGARCMVPAAMVPSWNVSKAFERNVQNSFLINTWGGLGDQVCAEPAIRFALKHFKRQTISLASRQPSLFSHLKFKEVFDTREVTPKWEDHTVFQTIVPPTHLLWEFASHMLTHCVDFPSICMWRFTLPNQDKEIHLPDHMPDENTDFGRRVKSILFEQNLIPTVIVHAGRHWPSKTFPKMWWDAVIQGIGKAGIRVVLVGQKVDENVGYVEVNPHNCIDLRDKLPLNQFVALLKNSRFLLTNDSAPIHIASAGKAFIGYVATCKHPDYIVHWRNGVFGWNTKNFGKDGIWNHVDYSPVQTENVVAEDLPPGVMDKVLPDPQEVISEYVKLTRHIGR
jgi:hypothetical protein